MRAQEFVAELFAPGKEWQWSFTGSQEAVAVFRVGSIPYQFYAYRPSENSPSWDVEFKNADRGKDRTSKFGLTGTGNSTEVMSIIVDIMRGFLAKYQGKISELTFTADESSRQALYARMAKRLLPTWQLQQNGGFFKLVAPEAVTEDWGVEKYAIPLPIGDYLAGSSDEFAPAGNYQSAEDLHNEVSDLIDAGVDPQQVNIDPRTVLATQDWLSNAGGDDPLFDEYPDRPVIYSKSEKLYILDGHHRTTRAWRAGRPISVYLFSDQQQDLDESAGKYREIEFVCANPDFCDATDPEQQQQLRQLLQRIPGVITVYQDQSDYSAGQFSLSAIYQTAAQQRQIIAAARALGVAVDLARPVDDDYVDRAVRGELEGQIQENFADGKKPGRKGLSKRVGIPKKASLSQLQKIASSSTGERRRMAQWQLNMRRGKAKKKK